MKLAIVGSRGIASHARVMERLSELRDEDTLVSGGAPGIDTYAAELAGMLGRRRLVIRPDYGAVNNKKMAPLVRNHSIAMACDEMLAVWDGWSRGTAFAIACAVARGKRVEVVLVNTDAPLAEAK